MTQADTNELRSIAEEFLNQIPVKRGDTLHAFISQVLMWLAKWCGEKPHRDASSRGYCAFVLAPELLDNSPDGADEMHLFKNDTANPEIGGHVYITEYAMNKVFRFSGTCRNLTDVYNMLVIKGLDDHPLVAFDTDTQNVFFFFEGASKRSSQFPLRVDLPRPFTISYFEEILDRIYKENLMYPNRYLPVWHNSEDRVPCRKTELVIQGFIVCFLKAMVIGNRPLTSKSEWLTIYEQTTNAGRIDIAVYVQNKCIIASELKVLRHCYFPDLEKRKKSLAKAQNEKQVADAMAPILVQPKWNEKWALHGVHQAARYKSAVNAKEAALVLYDMSEEDKDIPTVKAQCEKDDVRYLRFYLYNELQSEA